MMTTIFFSYLLNKDSVLSVRKRSLIFKVILAAFIITLSMGIMGVQANAASNSTIILSIDSGPVRTNIGITGQGFPFESDIDLYWSTREGSWVVDGHDFLGSTSLTIEYVIASVKSDNSGTFDAQIKVPYDFGGQHYITAFVKGNNTEMGKAMFTLLPSFSISSNEGLEGTPITIQAYGLGRRFYTTNWHVLWDNKYVGYVSAITTQGNATFTVTAVGGVGTHYIDIYEGYPGPAYLNIHQSPPNPVYYNPPTIPFHAEFTITPPAGIASRETIETLALGSLGLILATMILTSFISRKNDSQKTRMRTISSFVAVIAIILSGIVLFSAYSVPPTTQADLKSSEIRPDIILPNGTTGSSYNSSLPTLSVSSLIATVDQDVSITGSNFPTDKNVELTWTTRSGSYLRGWDDLTQTLGIATSDSNGEFTFNMKVPYDLEGSHEISAKSEDIPNVNNASLYITRSADISLTEGPSGTTVEITMTGVGWTFVTNTATIVYDNSFVGYVCGFNTQGNVTAWVTAVGKPGIHTIDIYPTLYNGPPSGTSNAIYRYPLLTPQDHPAQSAAFKFEFLITESDQKSATEVTISSPENLSIITIVIGVIFLALQAKDNKK
jgi:hypothetical protein